MKNEDYDRQKLLVERFIEQSNLKDFDRLKKLSDPNNSKYEKYRNKKFNAKKLFHSFKFSNQSYEIYKKLKNNSNRSKNRESSEDKDNGDEESYTPFEINNYKIDFRSVIFDPEYKNKCLKGNYKWGNMKFKLQKLNMAKRRGISFEELKLNKIDNNLKKKNTMEINGRLIIGEKKNNIYCKNNKTEILNTNRNKKVNDIINKKISDFIKRKYSGKKINKIHYHSNNMNEDGVNNLII
jgi:hypothetical protein